MGAFSYCRRCNTGMAPASLAECLTGKQQCHRCAAEAVPNRSASDAAAELQERVDTLELLVKALAARIQKPSKAPG